MLRLTRRGRLARRRRLLLARIGPQRAKCDTLSSSHVNGTMRAPSSAAFPTNSAGYAASSSSSTTTTSGGDAMGGRRGGGGARAAARRRTWRRRRRGAASRCRRRRGSRWRRACRPRRRRGRRRVQAPHRALFSRLSLGALLPRPAASTVFRSPCTSCASSSAQRAAASLAATHDDDTIHWPPRTPSVYFIVRPHSRSPSSPAAFEPHCVEHTTCVTSALHCLTTLAPSLAASVFSRF